MTHLVKRTTRLIMLTATMVTIKPGSTKRAMSVVVLPTAVIHSFAIRNRLSIFSYIEY